MGTLVFQANLGGAVNLIGPNTASTVNFTLPSADGTSGQALVTNGSGTLSFSTFTSGAAGSNTQVQFNSSGAFAGSANLTFDGTTLTSNALTVTNATTLSAGTANGVAYLNGSKVVTTGSALTFDGTNTRLGVGVASPGYTIDSGGIINTASAVYWGGGVGKLQYSGTDAYIDSTGSTVFRISGSTEQMRLTSTGLGIGTSSPASKLDVYSTGNTTLTISGSSGGGGDVSQIDFFRIGSNVTSSVKAIRDGGNTSGALTFYTALSGSNTERMRLDSSGNLGLGVTPSAWISSGKAIDIAGFGSVAQTSSGSLASSFNAYQNSAGNWIYKTTNAAAQYQCGLSGLGQHAWFTAASGTAGNAITFTQAMTLDASGNLGIGTTSPNNKLSLAGYTTSQQIAEIYASKSGTASTNIGSGAAIQLANSTSSKSVLIQGSDDTLQFWANGGSWNERARIDSSGNLLVGKTDPSAAVVGTTITAAGLSRFTNSASTNTTTTLETYSTGASAFRFYVGFGGTVYATSTTITAISDQRLKENIRDLDEGLATVLALKPRRFDWKEGKGKNIKDDRGFIAQEFEQVLPDMVEEWRDPAPEGEEPYKAVNANLIPTLVKALQEMKAIIDDQAARIAALEAK